MEGRYLVDHLCALELIIKCDVRAELPLEVHLQLLYNLFALLEALKRRANNEYSAPTGRARNRSQSHPR
jgi:hypothetical protein